MRVPRRALLIAGAPERVPSRCTGLVGSDLSRFMLYVHFEVLGGAGYLRNLYLVRVVLVDAV